MASDHPPTPASSAPTGTAGGATPACAELAAEYADLWARIGACAAAGDDRAEAALRNRAQVVLARMTMVGCPLPDRLQPGQHRQA